MLCIRLCSDGDDRIAIRSSPSPSLYTTLNSPHLTLNLHFQESRRAFDKLSEILSFKGKKDICQGYPPSHAKLFQVLSLGSFKVTTKSMSF